MPEQDNKSLRDMDPEFLALVEEASIPKNGRWGPPPKPSPDKRQEILDKYLLDNGARLNPEIVAITVGARRMLKPII